MLKHCSAVTLQKCFVNYETSVGFPLTLEQVDNDGLGWTHSFKKREIQSIINCQVLKGALCGFGEEIQTPIFYNINQE